MMANNWPKAIQYTGATIAANISGAAVSFALDSLWPMAIVVLGGAVVVGYSIAGNAIREWRINRLERQSRI